MFFGYTVVRNYVVLTVGEMPVHTHMQYVTANAGHGTFNTREDYRSDENNLDIYEHVPTGSSGGDKAHNNIQPFFVTYIFRRKQ